RRRAAKRNHAVEVFAAPRAVGHAEEQVAAIAPGDAGELLEELRLDAVEEARDRGLGEYDQLRAGAFGKAHVGRQDRGVALGTELEVLLDVPLQQGSAHRLARG